MIKSVRSVIAFFVLCLILLLLQSTALGLLLPASLIPNLLLCLCLYLALFEGGAIGLLGSFIAGLFLDLASATLLGPWAGAFVIIYCVLSVLSDRIFVESRFAIGVIAMGSSVAVELLFFLLSILSAETFFSSWLGIVGRAVATGIVASLMFSVFSFALPIRRITAI